MTSPRSLSDRARIRIFEDLAQRHLELSSDFPVCEKAQIGGRSMPLSAGEMFCLASLRKFVTKKESVYLVDVATSMRSLRGQRPDLADEVQRRISEAGNRPYKLFHQSADPPDGRPRQVQVSPADTYYDTVYGIYLHADYDRWERVKTRPPFVGDLGLGAWRRDVEELLRDVLDQLLAGPERD